MTRIICALVALVCLSACEAPPVTTVDQAAELEAVMALSSEWSDLVASGSPEQVLAHWADDAVMMAPNLDFIEGKDAIAAYLEHYIGEDAVVPNFSIEWTPRSGYVSKSGDLAYLIETNLIQFDDENGDRVSVPNKVITVWRKNENGEWKNVVDMWNSFPAPE